MCYLFFCNDAARPRSYPDRHTRSLHVGLPIGRSLGMGDVVSLVEKAGETMEQDAAERLAAKMAKGQFDMEDLRSQLRQMRNMGGIGALASMIPGLEIGRAHV